MRIYSFPLPTGGWMSDLTTDDNKATGNSLLYTRHFILPLLRDQLRQGQNYYVWLACLIRYEQIANSSDVVDRWLAHPKIPQIRKIELAVKSDTGGG